MPLETRWLIGKILLGVGVGALVAAGILAYASSKTEAHDGLFMRLTIGCVVGGIACICVGFMLGSPN